MNKSSKAVVRRKNSAVRKTTAVRSTWRRWIVAGQQDHWIGRLAAADCPAHGGWAFTERPGRSRVLLEVYVEARAAAAAFVRAWGGRVRAVDAREWIKARPAPPTRIGRRLEIIHVRARSGKQPAWPRLYIPHGVAFGSGEHATTAMLLRALARHDAWSKTAVLDLGTGSGVLALAARLFGARKIVATDFDPDAVRTARDNEALNFSRPLVRWRRADVRKLRATARYDLVLANLFSGILGEAAPQIAGCVSPGGRLWLSGILDSQREEVAAAYRGRGLQWIRAVRCGKWVMMQWQRAHREPAADKETPPKQSSRCRPRPG
jgi:ribosomal protein L11 methyltransferase